MKLHDNSKIAFTWLCGKALLQAKLLRLPVLMLLRACRFPLLAAASRSAEEPFSWASYRAAKSPVLMLMPPGVRLPKPYCPSSPTELQHGEAFLQTTACLTFTLQMIQHKGFADNSTCQADVSVKLLVLSRA